MTEEYCCNQFKIECEWLVTFVKMSDGYKMLRPIDRQLLSGTDQIGYVDVFFCPFCGKKL